MHLDAGRSPAADYRTLVGKLQVPVITDIAITESFEPKCSNSEIGYRVGR